MSRYIWWLSRVDMQAIGDRPSGLDFQLRRP